MIFWKRSVKKNKKIETMPLPSISQFLIESSVCLLVFYGFYALVLRRETFFQLNRFYLLLTPLLSIVLPLVHLEVQEAQAEEVLDPWALALLAGSEGIPQTLERPLADQFTVGDALVYVYLVGLTLMLLRLGIALYGLLELLRSRRRTLRGPAASFFGHIMHRKDTAGDERDLLDAHEQVHARQWHSLDVLFLELLIAGYWFHPLIYGFRRQLKLIHEFIADALVVRRTGTRYAYARLLVRYSTARQDHPMLNTFASFTKKRLLMLKQQHSPAYRKIKYVLVLPLFMGLAALFSFDLVDDLPQTVQQPLAVATGAMDEVARVPLMQQVDKGQSAHVDSVPVEKGTAKLFASDDKVLQEPIFVIDGEQISKAKVQNLDIQTLHTMQFLKGESALEEYGESGRNGVVMLTTTDERKDVRVAEVNRIYNHILLQKDIRESKMTFQWLRESDEYGVTVTAPRIDGPLYLLDGKSVKKSELKEQWETINVNRMAIINGAKAEEKYGEDGKNGVVELYTTEGEHNNRFDLVMSLVDNILAKEINDRIEIKNFNLNLSVKEERFMRGLDEEEAGNKKLLIIDGHQLPPTAKDEYELVDPAIVKKVEVYTPGKAVETFGEAGRNGALAITTHEGDWKPGDLPAYQSIKEAQEKADAQPSATEEMNVDTNGGIAIRNQRAGDPPLYVIDGKAYPEDGEVRLEDLDPRDIASVNIYKGEKALNLYGEDGANGVVEIWTKAGAAAKKEIEKADLPNPEKENYIYVIDGKEFDIEPDQLEQIVAPGDIENVTIYKGQDVISKTGNQDGDVLIEINTKSGVTQEKKENGFGSGLDNDKDPLFILDGEELPADAQPILQQVEPNDIGHINVYRGEQAIEKFGEKGKHGVVEIFTKGYDRKQERAEKKKKKGTRVTVLPPEQGETAPATIDWEEADLAEETPAKNLNLQAFPNPANDVMTVSFNVPDASERVNLALYDMDGRLLRVLQEGSFPAGVQRFTIGEGLSLTSDGTFILRLAVGDQIQTRKVVFQ